MNNIIHIIQHTARAATVLLLALLTAQTAWAQELTDFLPVSSSGTASGYFAYSNHFYKVDWTGINTDETSSVQLFISSYNDIRYMINGNSGTDNLYASATESDKWSPSHITSLTPGQSSDGYTNFGKLATGASHTTNPQVFKKVCTVTCVAALKPKWNWSSDHSTCTATFMCAENTSLTATVNATVTSSSEPYAANVTFNGTSYSYVAPVTYSITYVLNGGTNAASNPNTYRDDETVTLSDPMRAGYVFEGWYDNSGFSGTAVTGIPYDSSGDKTFYAKWKAEIDGLTYDETNGWFVIDSPAALNALSAYSKSHTCEGKTFKQTVDIALSGSFSPIGEYSDGKKFQGTYDGGGHVITGLSVSTTYGNAGMFLCVYYGTVKNVVLIDPVIAAGTIGKNGNAGALVGYAQHDGKFSNCYVINPTLTSYSTNNFKGAITGDGSSAFGNSYTGCYFYSSDPNDGLRGVGNSENTTGWRFYKLSTNSNRVTAVSDGTKFTYDGASYITSGSSVTLTITPEKGYILSALTVNGTDVTGSVSNNSYTFNMPTEDITVTAAFVKETFTYVDMNGVTQTVEAERITSDSQVGLYSGWYAVGGNVTRNSGFNLVSGGDGVVINIILCDGATLSLPNSTINTAGGGKPNLVIWGQENGTGTLSCLSISSLVTSVTVNGGKLYCGVSNYNCAINGNLNVNGGEVHLTAGFNTCVNGSVTYNGGILDTKKISGNTTLNWSNAATDRVKAEYGGSVTIADGKFFKDASGNYYYGSLTDAQKNAIKNVELQPSPNAQFITVDAAVHGAATAPAVAERVYTVTVSVAADT
ncbi:MAG: InlB B-repeat-containing protein, partial [Bacteroidaceae bacterium]|nr:InlB B-repeat-containing protein [Bacteroidaceae bacterium]